jgi:hypothetical protein
VFSVHDEQLYGAADKTGQEYVQPSIHLLITTVTTSLQESGIETRSTKPANRAHQSSKLSKTQVDQLKAQVCPSDSQVISREMLRADITCFPQSVSVVQGLPGQPQLQVQVMNVEYLESSVETDTVVRISSGSGGWLDVVVELAAEPPVDEGFGEEVVVEAIDGVCDGEADDEEDSCDSAELRAG